MAPYTAVSDRLNLQDNKAKAEFEKLFTEKFSELLVKSEDQGIFFGSPAQVSLHNYAKQQYFEDKNRMKVNDNIINAYK